MVFYCNICVKWTTEMTFLQTLSKSTRWSKLAIMTRNKYLAPYFHWFQPYLDTRGAWCQSCNWQKISCRTQWTLKLNSQTYSWLCPYFIFSKFATNICMKTLLCFPSPKWCLVVPHSNGAPGRHSSSFFCQLRDWHHAPRASTNGWNQWK